MKKTTSFDFSTRSDYDPNKTITSTTNSEIIKLLQEFPEYIDEEHWDFEITNVGVIKFTKKNTNPEIKVFYDILSADDSITLDSVEPDTSILALYTHINNPFNYRIINLNNGDFIPDRKIIKDGLQYIRINADFISLDDGDLGFIHPNNSGWFIFPSTKKIKSIFFYYKQSFYLTGNASNNLPQTISNFTPEDYNFSFCISKDPNGRPFSFDCSGLTGYLEVR